MCVQQSLGDFISICIPDRQLYHFKVIVCQCLVLSIVSIPPPISYYPGQAGVWTLILAISLMFIIEHMRISLSPTQRERADIVGGGLRWETTSFIKILVFATFLLSLPLFAIFYRIFLSIFFLESFLFLFSSFSILRLRSFEFLRSLLMLRRILCHKFFGA